MVSATGGSIRRMVRALNTLSIIWPFSHSWFLLILIHFEQTINSISIMPSTVFINSCLTTLRVKIIKKLTSKEKKKFWYFLTSSLTWQRCTRQIFFLEIHWFMFRKFLPVPTWPGPFSDWQLNTYPMRRTTFMKSEHVFDHNSVASQHNHSDHIQFLYYPIFHL